MQRPIWRVSVALAVAMSAVILACPGGGGGDGGGEDDLLITATPRQINDQGMTSVIDVTATTADGTAGTGSVVLKAVAGQLGNGTAEETLTLGAGGKATTSFTCNKAQDAKCAGNVRIDGTWNTATSSTTLVVSSTPVPDGGGGTRPDAGTDGGRPDASLPDGGTAQFIIIIETAKPQLVGNTGDQTAVTATVTRTSNNTPAAGVQVTFNTTLGSFTAAAGTGSTQATTDANGRATVTLHVANTAPGTARITATHGDGTGLKDITFAAVSSMVYKTGSAKTLLGLASSGRETTTPITFRVQNSAQQPVPGIEVSFEVSGAAGATVTPTSVTNNMGEATTTLRSGDNVGVAIVRAIVTATKNSTPDVSANHPGTPIVGGKPSDRGLAVDCVQKNLGVLHAIPPPRDVETICSAKLVDRFGNPVGLTTSVQWYPESGSISSPVDSRPQMGNTPSADTGEAVTTFQTRSNFPPYAVTPLPGERFLGSATNPADRNPRDMAVTVIAVVAGEEDFYDGSGSAGILNGRWDPGEWFVDLGEPLVDRNDNGVWDPGEFYIDTERINCADPTAPARQNGKWDSPNGCWDSNTQIWRPIHLVYTGPLVQDFTLSPPQPANGYFVPVNGLVDVNFRWADAYFNRLSPDGASFTVTKTGNRGSARVQAGAPNTFDYGGFNIAYRKLEGTTTDGGIVLGGPCDTGKPTPPDSGTSPVATRCVHATQYTFPLGGNTGTIRLEGATGPQPPLPDGGVQGPINSVITIQANHNFSSSTGENFGAQYQ
ncbi:MAG TPA: Ig-like domain-containing protein [Myxococcaceae bacterium]|nr:Ig-like domain-containing protein [Myxococcaceae bacterium]